MSGLTSDEKDAFIVKLKRLLAAAERDLADLTVAYTDALEERDEARAALDWADEVLGASVPGPNVPAFVWERDREQVRMFVAALATPEGKTEDE